MSTHPAGAAWPQFVPKAVFDVHVKDIDGRIAALLGRVSMLESVSSDTVSHVEDIRRRCQEELATKQALSAAESRIDLDTAILHKELEESAAEAQDFASREAAAVRADHGVTLEQLGRDLAAANGEIGALGTALEQLSASSAGTFVTKAAHAEACDRLAHESSASCAGLRATLDVLHAEKASRRELEDRHGALHAAHGQHQRGLGQAEAGLGEALRRLAELERTCREDMASRRVAREMADTISELQQRLFATGEEQKAMQHDFGVARERVNTMASQTERQFSNVCRVIDEVSVDCRKTGVDLAARFERQELSLAALEQRERAGAEELRRHAKAQQAAHTTLESSHRALQQTLQLHALSAQEEADKTRKFSTSQFLDQMDRALKLSESVERVEKGHVDLKGTLQAIRLPKV